MTVINDRKTISIKSDKSEARLLNLTVDWVKEHQLMYLVLLLGFLVGCVYYSISPAWQHYDEPTQFEYVWLIANKPGLPNRGDYDQFIRREIAASMVEHNFFQGLGFYPNLVDSNPIWIGISQIGELPLYYWVAALPLRLFRFSDVVFQLKIVRLVSIILFLVTVLAAYGIACELTRKNHPLRWLLPASVALLPSFVDIMTAVNDDVGAVAFFSIFLWIGLRLITKGFSFPRLCLLVLFALISFWTKNTVVIAVVLLLIPILFSIFRGPKQKYAWFTILAGTIALILVGVSWGDAAFWYRSSSPKSSSRTTVANPPLGKSVIRLSVHSGEAPPSLSQIIPNARKKELLDKPVTLGAWIWANKPAKVRTPMIVNENQVIYKDVQVDEEPRFFMVTTKLEPKNRPLIVAISPLKARSRDDLTIFYDGVILTHGNHPQDEIPVYRDGRGESGTWSGVEFLNLVRNPSGENSWPYLRSWADTLLYKYFPGRPSLVLASVLDLQNFRTYYSITTKTLFQSFWGRFGWGNVSLAGFHPYLILGIYTLVGVLGAIISLIRNRARINWALLLFLGLPVLTIWGFTLARGVSSYLGDRFIVPVARYAYPALIPTMLIIDLGWLEMGSLGKDFLKIPVKVAYAVAICFLIGLNVVSIYSILRFYQG